MTMLIADIASYQGDLTLTELRAAGFTAVNVKVSHGLTQRSVHPDAAGWIARARAAGVGVSTFHWLDGSATGAAQAAYAHRQLVALGAVAGPFAHVVDVESDAAAAVYRDYVTAMTGLLGRPICTYTGDHWWIPRGWAGRTPWLWAAPNAGYLPAYPGDTSPHWTAGYGGWTDLAALQWTGSLSVWGTPVSASAIRSAGVWAAMTGEKMTAAKPNHRAARALMLQHLDLHPGQAVNYDLDPLEAGIVGDTDHAEGGDSYHLGEDQIRTTGHRYSVDESPRDRSGLDDYASAMDYGYFKVTTPRGTFDLYDYNAWLIPLCRDGDPDTVDLREVIYSLDGQAVRRWDREGVRSTGDSSHRTHTHHSEYRDANGHRMLRLATRWLQHIGLIPEEDDMPTVDEIADEVIRRLDAAPLRNGRTLGGSIDALVNPDPAKNAVAGVVWLRLLGDPERPDPANPGQYLNSTAGGMLRFLPQRVGAVGRAILDAMEAYDRGDDADRAAARTALEAAIAEVPDATLDALGGPARTPEETAAALRAVLGDRAADVGRILAGL